MTYTIEKSPESGFFIKLDGEVVGWTPTPWGARLFIDKHAKAGDVHIWTTEYARQVSEAAKLY